MRDRYRHKATGCEALKTGTTLTSGEYPKIQLSLLTDPRPFIAAEDERFPFQSWEQRYQELICCALGEHSLGNTCPIHGHPARTSIPLPLTVDPIEIWQPELEADWEPVE